MKEEKEEFADILSSIFASVFMRKIDMFCDRACGQFLRRFHGLLRRRTAVPASFLSPFDWYPMTLASPTSWGFHGNSSFTFTASHSGLLSVPKSILRRTIHRRHKNRSRRASLKILKTALRDIRRALSLEDSNLVNMELSSSDSEEEDEVTPNNSVDTSD
ncbi:hypothetical protein STEG23_036900 [Scotinomys teguina]